MVKYSKQKSELPLVIVKGEKPALFGRNWLEKSYTRGEIFAIEKPNPVDRLIKKYAKLFEGGMEDKQFQSNCCPTTLCKANIQESETCTICTKTTSRSRIRQIGTTRDY